LLRMTGKQRPELSRPVENPDTRAPGIADHFGLLGSKLHPVPKLCQLFENMSAVFFLEQMGVICAGKNDNDFPFNLPNPAHERVPGFFLGTPKDGDLQFGHSWNLF
jgi:hypothetical protein